MAVKSNIRQAIISKSFCISFVGVCIAVLLSPFESILSAFRSTDLSANGFHATLILDALKSDTICLVLPILCTLPYTSSFVDDLKSGYIKSYLIRTDIKSYIKGKIIANALAGALTLMLGIMAAYLLSMLIFSPMEAALLDEQTAQPYFTEIFGKAILFAFSGAFWATVGMTFATVTNSKYMAFASPFIIFYVLIILYERYFDTLYVLYPKEWLNPSDWWVFGDVGVMLLVSLFTLIVALIFTNTARRRIEQL